MIKFIKKLFNKKHKINDTEITLPISIPQMPNDIIPRQHYFAINNNIDNYNERELDSIELNFLKYLNNKIPGESTIAKYWTDTYDLDLKELYTQFLLQDLIIESEKYKLTKKGKILTKHLKPSITKNIDLEDECINLIIENEINLAYKKIATWEVTKPFKRGLVREGYWEKESLEGLSDNKLKYYNSMVNYIDSDYDFQHNQSIINASIILADMLGSNETYKLIKRKVPIKELDSDKLIEYIHFIPSLLKSELKVQRIRITNPEGEYQFSTALDLSTCKKCGNLDREVFQYKDAKVGVNYPPICKQCRCTTISHFEGNIKERWARDPLTGKSTTVKDMSYNTWYKNYVKNNKEYQEMISEKQNDNL